MAARDPLQGVNIAQAAGAAFHVRLEVIAGPVIALMAYILLFDFCRKELFRWPEAVAEYMFLQFKEQRDVANKQTRFNQVSGDAEVRQPLQQALFEGAHAVADFQLDIPQQRQQLADLLRLLIGQLFTAQDKQVDIGKRVQFAAAVTADGDQRDVVHRPEPVLDP